MNPLGCRRRLAKNSAVEKKAFFDFLKGRLLVFEFERVVGEPREASFYANAEAEFFSGHGVKGGQTGFCGWAGRGAPLSTGNQQPVPQNENAGFFGVFFEVW